MRLLLLPLFAWGLLAPAPHRIESAPEGGARIGTYDSRAIAIAYAPSRFNPVAEKVAEQKAARAAGDAERVRELEAWGEAHQRRLHRQGFSRVPVDDLLAHVQDGVAEVARRLDLDAVTMACDWVGADTVVVDVTDELVRLYAPSEHTLRTIEQLREQPPLDLDQVEAGHEH